MNTHLNTQWQKVLDVIQTKIPLHSTDYQKWFAPIKPIGLKNDVLIIRVPSNECYLRMENDYIELLSKGLVEAFGPKVQLEYQIPDHIAQLPVNAPHKYLNGAESVEQEQAGPTFNTHLDRRMTLNNFYQSVCNRLAYSAAKSIISKPGESAFNPLFVYGASGVGKTHIMHAVGNEIIRQNPKARVVYVPTQTFKRQFVTASIVEKNTDNFFNYYQNIDVLLIDDIQELAEAVATQNAFFQIFNNLKLLGKQLIITSDRPPVELKGLEERLYTRLKWGLTVEIERPDPQLRKAILINKLNEAEITLPDDVFSFIIKHTKNNVRDIEGTLTSLMAHALFNNTTLDIDLARKVMAQTIGLDEDKKVTVSDILKTVASYYNVSSSDILGRKRTRIITTARQMVMYLSKVHTDTSLKAVGLELGKRDHSTIIHGYKTIQDLKGVDQRIAKDLTEITALLNL